MATNIFKKVTIKDQEYVIQKFDSKTGLKLARLVMAKAQPLVPLLAAQEQDKSNGNAEAKQAIISKDDTFKAVFAILGELKDEDIDALVDKCLRVCYVDLPAGRQAVMDEAGNYGVDGVEYDPVVTTMLCYEAIKWGAADFFDGNPLLSNLFRK